MKSLNCFQMPPSAPAGRIDFSMLSRREPGFTRENRMIRRGGRPLHGGVDRNTAPAEALRCRRSPPSRGRGSKRRSRAGHAGHHRRPLHGGVDRNSGSKVSRRYCGVAPFTGAWIETRNSVDYKSMVRVAPFTGAWIETRIRSGRLVSTWVAPFTGAWIETCSARAIASWTPSPPSRGRGSKQTRSETVAWRRKSPPSRGRGSKPEQGGVHRRGQCRPLHGGVDRNEPDRRDAHGRGVAPFTGAWIET